ncbi:UDP-3-O-acyl-N-acetylglucosamine deacetylase [Acidocella sp.]|uniref:UDP-3-O-acyl-N-acetylglucosamine deacetylase n=1 Tax=Acidocella sp. TaxID=50710 RepID=UPI002622F577|nr:UDP-3-O-acyl-N-acetylglucosamine deacetylase [Acidocella sp.]
MAVLKDRYSFTPAEPAPGARRTIRAEICGVGRGLHSGRDVTMVLKPGAVGSGVVFCRADLGIDLPAKFNLVTDTRLCTLIAEGEARVGTIEHLMAAVMAVGIDDLRVEVDAAELPIFDGSAAPFLFLLEAAGVVEHGGLRERIEILRTVRVEQNGAFAELRPHREGGAGFEVSLQIEFAAKAIGAQSYHFLLSEEGFAEEIAPARTFAMRAEIEALRAAGLARGGSLANAIVVDNEAIVNPEGLRFEDEFVRHKLLDVIGDLALAGAPISGRFVGCKTGHGLNNLLLRALFADQANYRVTNGSLAAQARQLTAA